MPCVDIVWALQSISESAFWHKLLYGLLLEGPCYGLQNYGSQDTGNGGGNWDGVHDNYRQQYGDSYGY